MKVVIGCPIKDRAWIFDRWHTHALEAVRQLPGSVDLHFAFVVHPNDTDTLAHISTSGEGLRLHVSTSDEADGNARYSRNWSPERLALMASLRNQLLGVVRGLEPDLFWSLDSDILAHPTALLSATEMLRHRHFDAVGQCCFMSDKGTLHPSYGMLNSVHGGLIRPFQPGQFPVDVIMASKVMTPPAYSIDYANHRLGEDIGWSIKARSAGLRLGWDGTVVSKHVMKPADLDVLDPRCGY